MLISLKNICALRLIMGEHDHVDHFHFHMAFLVVEILNQRHIYIH